MLAFLIAPENVAFSAALLLMLLIGAVEAVGLGASAADLDAPNGPGGDLLGWLGVGRLPLLMLLVVALAAFGLAGLALQQTALALTGGLLPALAAAGVALTAALPLTGVLARGLARVLPRDETTAVGLDSLIGRRARIVVGTASAGSPARARVHDAFGQPHYVLVEPNEAEQRFAEGLDVLLVRREGGSFRAISDASTQAIFDLGDLK